jgi:DNA-binding MarR family transcriptional regulator
MDPRLSSQDALSLWRGVLVASHSPETPDLTARQMAILLTVYLKLPPHTVRGLSAALAISKPAVTRALDTLCILGFVKRRRDDADGRNVIVQRTVKGSVFVSDFADTILRQAAHLRP